MGIYSDFTTFFTLIYLKQLHLQDTCPLHEHSQLPVTSESCPLPMEYSSLVESHYCLYIPLLLVLVTVTIFKILLCMMFTILWFKMLKSYLD